MSAPLTVGGNRLEWEDLPQEIRRAVVVMHGGGDPQRLWEGFAPARDADAEAVTAVLAAATGYFV